MFRFVFLVLCFSTLAGAADCAPGSPEAARKMDALTKKSVNESAACGKYAAEVEALAPGNLENKTAALQLARKLRAFRGNSKSSHEALSLALAGQGASADLGALHECDGSSQFIATWKRLLGSVSKLKLSDGERKEVRASLVTFLGKKLDGPATFPEVMGCLDLARAAVDCKLVAGGEQITSLHARGRELGDELEKESANAPQMSTKATTELAESEKCTINAKGDAALSGLRRTEPLRKELLAWLKTVR